MRSVKDQPKKIVWSKSLKIFTRAQHFKQNRALWRSSSVDLYLCATKMHEGLLRVVDIKTQYSQMVIFMEKNLLSPEALKEEDEG